MDITITDSDNTQNDNPTYYNQLQMALRPMRNVKCLNDYREDTHLTSPLFIPILLAPTGSSFSLIDTDPLLRVNNSNLTGTSAKLYHIYINHTRTLKAHDGGVNIEI